VNEETGFNDNSDGFNWAETWGTSNIVAYLNGITYASTISASLDTAGGSRHGT
jgi:hypothetical protein